MGDRRGNWETASEPGPLHEKLAPSLYLLEEKFGAYPEISGKYFTTQEQTQCVLGRVGSGPVL